MKEKNIVRIKYWMAFIGNHMGDIAVGGIIFGFIFWFLGGIGSKICGELGISNYYVGVYLFPLIVIGLIFGLINWHTWAETNSIRLKDRLMELERSETRAMLTMLRKQKEEMLAEDRPASRPCAEYYVSLAKKETELKNDALKEAEEYKDLYERLLYGHQLAVGSLTKENDDLKARLNSADVNAITDLE